MGSDLSWEYLVSIEPELLDLQREAKSIPLYNCGVNWFYGPGGLKERLVALVGYDARRADLRNEKAYDVAYDAVYDALPYCDHQCIACGAPVPPEQSFLVQVNSRPSASLFAKGEPNDAYVSRKDSARGLLNSWTAVVDVLGFKNLVVSSAGEGKGNWSFASYVETLERCFPWLKSGDDDRTSVKIYSDNILLGAPVYDDGMSEFGSVAHSICRFQMALATRGVFVRGGLSVGPLYMDKNIVFGKSLIDAHAADKKNDPPRIALTRPARLALAIYASIGSPFSSRRFPVMVDTDGAWFLDYLGAVCASGEKPSLDSVTLAVHRERIIDGATKFKHDAGVAAKYHWLAVYHNAVCSLGLGNQFLIPLGSRIESPMPLMEEDVRTQLIDFPYERRRGHTKTLINVVNRD